MPRITRVYTRTGDDGTTALATGERVAKDSARVGAYGAVDELSSCLGVAAAVGLEPSLRTVVERIQNELFHLGAELATPGPADQPPAGPRIEARHVEALEAEMDRWTSELPALANFVLPGGSAGAAHLHVARAVCRRAERETVALRRREPVREEAVRYLNRLSDALFVMARVENAARGASDVLWDSRA
ncbi:MAG TPA: cob(I)yrinic acid a,c-diamide adenosyltransferase [Thermoanaerobaculia bacterium]|nr:cob(I)yrinic acid a,c-diamide adenosyltransferase [Thermoanaerobaculia bacterium]